MVYLINQPTIAKNGYAPNLTSLAKYGEIKILLETGRQPDFDTPGCLNLIHSRLSTFDPDTDYIAWAGGAPLAVALTTAALMILGIYRVRWMRLDRAHGKDGTRDASKGKFVPVVVDLLLGAEAAWPLRPNQI